MTPSNPEHFTRDRLRRAGFTVAWFLTAISVAVVTYAALIFGGR